MRIAYIACPVHQTRPTQPSITAYSSNENTCTHAQLIPGTIEHARQVTWVEQISTSNTTTGMAGTAAGNGHLNTLARLRNKPLTVIAPAVVHVECLERPAQQCCLPALARSPQHPPHPVYLGLGDPAVNGHGDGVGG